MTTTRSGPPPGLPTLNLVPAARRAVPSPLRRRMLGALGAAPLLSLGDARAATDGLHDWGIAPELRDIEAWINSPPLRLAQLRGRAVLIDFWTHACINCLRTLPTIRRWVDTYGDAGLVVIGVHTPEFAFERAPSRVAAAVRRLKLTHPIAIDNQYATWKAFENQYWPAHYLIDGAGRIRHRQFGEGGHARMEKAIETLLANKDRV